jgi:hypothetical protein
MNNSRTQDLTEIFASIIKLMLASIRAQGLRSLMHLPMLCRLAIELRRFGKEFAAVMAAYEAGTLSAPAPPGCARALARPARPAGRVCIFTRSATPGCPARSRRGPRSATTG